MKEFKEVVKMRLIPTTFVFKCTLCNIEIRSPDRHFGLIEMNKHIVSNHSKEVNSLSKEELFSRKPDITIEKF